MQPVDNNTVVKLDLPLTVGEVNTILNGLGELPAKTSFDLIARVKGHTEQQLAALQTPPAKPELLTEDQ